MQFKCKIKRCTFLRKLNEIGGQWKIETDTLNYQQLGYRDILAQIRQTQNKYNLWHSQSHSIFSGIHHVTHTTTYASFYYGHFFIKGVSYFRISKMRMLLLLHHNLYGFGQKQRSASSHSRLVIPIITTHFLQPVSLRIYYDACLHFADHYFIKPFRSQFGCFHFFTELGTVGRSQKLFNNPPPKKKRWSNVCVKIVLPRRF